jgi:hypothetical protein
MMSRPSAVVAVIALLAVTTLAFAQQTPTSSSNRTMVVVIPLKYANPALIAAVVGGTVIPALNNAQWAQMGNGGLTGGYNGAGNNQGYGPQSPYSAGGAAYGNPGAGYGARNPGNQRGGYFRQPTGGPTVIAVP